MTLKGNYKILTGVVWEWKLSLSSFLYSSIMNTHFYKGKETQFKENRGLSCRVGSTASHSMPWTQPKWVYQLRSCDGGGGLGEPLTGQGRLPARQLAFRLPHSTWGEHTSPFPELGSPGRGFIGTEGSGYLCSSPPAALTSPVRSRQSAMQSALPLWPPQMLPLCWGPRPRSTGAWGGGREEATENKSCSVFLNCGSKNHLHLRHSP